MAARKKREMSAAMEIRLLRRHLEIAGDEPGDVDRILGFMDTARRGSDDLSAYIDRFLVEEHVRLRQGLAVAHQNQQELRKLHEEMTSPPWYPAIYMGMFDAGESHLARVYHGGTLRAVPLLESVDREALAVGDEVLLDGDLGRVVGHGSNDLPPAGETALFNRYTPDRRRMVLEWHDDEIVVDVADRLRPQQLSAGDRVRFDRNLWLALECIERSRTSKFVLEDTPRDTFAQIGGLEVEIQKIKDVIGTEALHPEEFRRYRARHRGSILLVGPPGNGKTTLARAIANWMSEICGAGSRFMDIKPGAVHSHWYSKSEANYREVFQVAREMGESRPEVPVVLFFDELDAIAARRGHSTVGTDDRVLNSLMTELDGLQRRGNILVIGATNRLSALDKAVVRPRRFGDLILNVPRPGRRAAAQIFSVFLEPDIPFAVGREEVIGAALTRMYGPNADNELARLMLRGGEQVSVRARNLISGASIENIVGAAKESAVLRAVSTGNSGLSVGDMLGAVEEEFDSLVGMLTRANCRDHLSDLPDDADVVRIERVARRPKNAHRFLTVA